MWAQHRTMSCGLRGKFDQCENISDGVSEAQNGSKENHENVVPFKFFFHHRFDLPKKNIEWVIAKIVCKKFLFEVVRQLTKRGPCVTESIRLKTVGSVLKLKMPQKSHKRL